MTCRSCPPGLQCRLKNKPECSRDVQGASRSAVGTARVDTVSARRRGSTRASPSRCDADVTRGDGGRLQPNYSILAGETTASALANVWEHSTPGHDRIGADATLRRFGSMLATDMLTNVVFKEFWPDIKRIFRR